MKKIIDLLLVLSLCLVSFAFSGCTSKPEETGITSKKSYEKTITAVKIGEPFDEKKHPVSAETKYVAMSYKGNWVLKGMGSYGEDRRVRWYTNLAGQFQEDFFVEDDGSKKLLKYQLIIKAPQPLPKEYASAQEWVDKFYEKCKPATMEFLGKAIQETPAKLASDRGSHRYTYEKNIFTELVNNERVSSPVIRLEITLN